MIPKRNYVRSKYITESAKDETCCWPGCNAPAQCWAHSNLGEDGKGKGIKAEDIYGAYLCSAHHDHYDGRIPQALFDSESEFSRAMKKSWKRLIEKKIIVIKGFKCG